MPSLRRFPPAGAVTLLLVLFASSAHAQDPGRPRATKDERSARVDEASRTSAATASTLRASINGWSLGLEQLAERPEAREIEVAVRTYRAELPDDVADEVLRGLMYAYRDASDGDLRAYAEFLESDAGRWFVGTVFKTHQAYFDDADNQVAEDLVSTATRKQAVPPSLPARR